MQITTRVLFRKYGTKGVYLESKTTLRFPVSTSVANQDPGSGAFLGSRMKKNPETGSGINIPDLVQNFSFFLVQKYLNSFIRIRIWDLVNPGSGIRNPGWKKSDPGETSRIRNTDFNRTKIRGRALKTIQCPVRPAN